MLDTGREDRGKKEEERLISDIPGLILEVSPSWKCHSFMVSYNPQMDIRVKVSRVKNLRQRIVKSTINKEHLDLSF